MTTSTMGPQLDEQAVEAFAGRLLDMFAGAMLTYLVDLGRRTGLFDAAAAAGPATSAAIARHAGLEERYVREWLGAMVTGGVFDYDAAERRYSLPAEHAACLAGAGAGNLAPLAYLTTVLAAYVPEVAAAFRDGGGVPYERYLPEVRDVLDTLGAPIYDNLLVPELVPLAPGLEERLRAGARVADVACGTGRALVNLAAAFPASTFVGYDQDEGGLERGRALAARRGLGNVTFERCDVATLTVEKPLDAVFVFNAIHDQVAPAAVLARIRDALRPGGILVMDEPRMSSRLEENVGNPMAPFIYGISTLHCLTVSLAHGGAGLGTAWGEQTALDLLADAGFGPVVVHDAPGDPGNGVFVTSRPG